MNLENMKPFKPMLCNFKSMTDERGGRLFPVECNKLPFLPARVFWVIDTPKGSIRGKHAHAKCLQFYICVKGRIKIDMDIGQNQYEIQLESGDGIFVDKLVWTSETYQTGKDILLVLCSQSYDPDDYIYTKKDLDDQLFHRKDKK
jgi:mannose-6-phosphate isomerase-like protein (cupin superfamily)